MSQGNTINPNILSSSIQPPKKEEKLPSFQQKSVMSMKRFLLIKLGRSITYLPVSWPNMLK